jgi:hypothetical protein
MVVGRHCPTCFGGSALCACSPMARMPQNSSPGLGDRLDVHDTGNAVAAVWLAGLAFWAKMSHLRNGAHGNFQQVPPHVGPVPSGQRMAFSFNLGALTGGESRIGHMG